MMTDNKEVETVSLDPGSLILVKEATLFYEGDSESSEDKATRQKGSRAFELELGLLASYSTFEKEYFYNKPPQTGYRLSVIFEEQIYTTTVDHYVDLKKKFDFIKIPSLPDPDETDRWLTNYYGGQGRLFRAQKNFHVRLGNSREITKYKHKLPDRIGVGNFFVRQGDVVVGIGVRRHVGRKLILFDFFVNGVLCWMEFEETRKVRGKRFAQYFRTIGEESANEKSLREQELW